MLIANCYLKQERLEFVNWWSSILYISKPPNRINMQQLMANVIISSKGWYNCQAIDEQPDQGEC